MNDIQREILKTSSETLSRKDDHLDLCSQKNVSSNGSAGWEHIKLPHSALPDLNFDEINLETQFLDQKFSAPFLISSMTGGSPRGEKINETLALFAQEMKIPMGVGSQRIFLEQKSFQQKDSGLFNLRKIAPRAILYANIGAVQLNYGVTTRDCLYLVENLQAQALILHLNPLQEAIQKEGDRNFKNLWPKISEICKQSPVPVILKETGCGLDAQSCVLAQEAGVKAVDVAGFGGTHWGYIEGLRHTERANLGEQFRSWGIPTVEALIQARTALRSSFTVIASGGIRNGLDAAKAFYLGAELAGLALPFLKAIEDTAENDQIEKLKKVYFELCEGLKISLFCTNSTNIAKLKEKGLELYEVEPH
jgi:isopentenyl-diphosphate delta-isomerase